VQARDLTRLSSVFPLRFDDDCRDDLEISCRPALMDIDEMIG